MSKRLLFAVVMAGLVACLMSRPVSAQDDISTNAATSFNAASHVQLLPAAPGGGSASIPAQPASDDYMYSKYDLFVGYSELSGTVQNGGEAALTWNLTHNVGFTFDFSGHYNSPFNEGQTTLLFLVGPKFTHYLTKDGRYQIFAHVLVGGGHYSINDFCDDGCSASMTGLTIAPGGGFDWVSSGGKWGWRVVDVDFVNTQFPNSFSHSSYRLSTGLLWHFGH